MTPPYTFNDKNPAQDDAKESTQVPELKVMAEDQAPFYKNEITQHAGTKRRFIKPALIILAGAAVIWGMYALLDDPISPGGQRSSPSSVWIILICFYVGRAVYKAVRKQ